MSKTDIRAYWLNREDASLFLGIDPMDLRDIPYYDLPYYKMGDNGDRRYLREDIEGYIDTLNGYAFDTPDRP